MTNQEIAGLLRELRGVILQVGLVRDPYPDLRERIDATLTRLAADEHECLGNDPLCRRRDPPDRTAGPQADNVAGIPSSLTTAPVTPIKDIDESTNAAGGKG